MLGIHRLLLACFILNVIIFTNGNAIALASVNFTSLDKKLIKLRNNFTKLRIKSEKAKEDWLASHDKLLSIEDLQIAYKNLIDLSKSDLDMLALRSIGIERSLRIPQKTYQNNYNRYIIKEIVASNLQQQLAKQIKNSHISLQNLVLHKEGALSNEQQSRLQYYRIEKIREQIQFQMQQKKLALVNYNNKNKAYRNIVLKNSNNTVNLIRFLDKIDNSNTAFNAIDWPNSIQVLTKNHKIQSPLKGKLVSEYQQLDKSGKITSGIRIAAFGKDTVHTPFDGLVVFANSFRDLGNVIIITHKGSKERWYTVLTGLSKLYIVPGQLVLTNEPLGSMSGKGSILYQELRQGKISVNPL